MAIATEHYAARLRPHEPRLVWVRFMFGVIAERGQHHAHDSLFTSELTYRQPELRGVLPREPGLYPTLAEAVAYAIGETHKDVVQQRRMLSNWTRALSEAESRLEALTTRQLQLPGIG